MIRWLGAFLDGMSVDKPVASIVLRLLVGIQCPARHMALKAWFHGPARRVGIVYISIAWDSAHSKSGPIMPTRK